MAKTDLATLLNAVRIAPGARVDLAKRDTVREDLFEDREAAEALTAENAAAIDALQNRLYAERTRALLVLLQGTDTSGKDGTIKGVFNACGPLGVKVTAFGKPSEQELAHDYLWRIHQATPPKGYIGIFNRSHYEDVLVVKVRALAPPEAIEPRYAQINAFEQHLTENGVRVLKFYLHISKDEQRERLQERLDNPEKHWKFNPFDLEDRKLWPAFEKAANTALSRCSTTFAPWHVVPADKKWRRNAIISTLVRATLEEMDPRYPAADFDPAAIKVK